MLQNTWRDRCVRGHCDAVGPSTLRGVKQVASYARSVCEFEGSGLGDLSAHLQLRLPLRPRPLGGDARRGGSFERAHAR
eukprot:1611931-Pyramimonas_sp.AAC.1